MAMVEYVELFVFVLFLHAVYVQVATVPKVLKSECGELKRSEGEIAVAMVAGLLEVSTAGFVGVLTMLAFFTLTQQVMQAIINVIIMWGSGLVLPVIMWKAVVEPRLELCSAYEQGATS